MTPATPKVSDSRTLTYPRHALRRPSPSGGQRDSSSKPGHARSPDQPTAAFRQFWRIPRRPGLFLIAAIVVAVLARFASTDSDRRPANSSPHFQIEAVAYSPDGQSLAACGMHYKLQVWNNRRPEPARPEMPIELDRDAILYALAFSPDSRSLAVAASELFTIWTLEPEGYQIVFQQHGTTYYSAAFSPDGSMLALGSANGFVALWDLPSMRQRLIRKPHNHLVTRLTFSADSRRLMSLGQSIALWDIASEVAIRTPQETDGLPSLRADLSPNGSILAQGDTWGKQPAILTDAESGKTLTTLAGTDPAVTTMAFSPDGRTVAAVTTDPSIRLWDVATGMEKTRLTLDTGIIKDIAFSPDSTKLAFGGNLVPLQIWDLNSQHSLPVNGPLIRSTD